MAKIENVSVYICDVCGEIEIPKCVECDIEEDDLPVGWTRLYEKVTMCSRCTKAYWYGAASASLSLINVCDKESI